jgi:hypothetical protein
MVATRASDLEEVTGITSVFAATLLIVSGIEWFTLFVANSRIPTSFELLLVYRGGWLFLAGAVWVGYLARSLNNRPLVICAAYATCFIAIMEFRGVWPWHGTFEAYSTELADWTLPAALSLPVAIVASYLFKRSPVKERTSFFLLGIVGCVGLVQMFMAKTDPNSFVSLRWLFLFVFLVVVAALHLFVRREG